MSPCLPSGDSSDRPFSAVALAPPDTTPTLVLAHGSWASRVAARLTASESAGTQSGAAVVVARDLGPADNAGVLERYPGWTVRVLVPEAGAPQGWTLLPYDRAAALLWGTE